MQFKADSEIHLKLSFKMATVLSILFFINIGCLFFYEKLEFFNSLY